MENAPTVGPDSAAAVPASSCGGLFRMHHETLRKGRIASERQLADLPTTISFSVFSSGCSVSRRRSQEPNPRPEDAEGCGGGHLMVLAPRRSRDTTELIEERGDLGCFDPHCPGSECLLVDFARLPSNLQAELGGSVGQRFAVEHSVGGKRQRTRVEHLFQGGGQALVRARRQDQHAGSVRPQHRGDRRSRVFRN